MFKSVSLGGSGWLVLGLLWFLKAIEVDFDESQASHIISITWELVGFLMLIVGQLRRKDLSWGFWRIKNL